MTSPIDTVGPAYNEVLAVFEKCNGRKGFSLRAANVVYQTLEPLELYLNQRQVIEKKIEKHAVDMKRIITAKDITPNVDALYRFMQLAPQTGEFDMEQVIEFNGKFKTLREYVTQEAAREEAEAKKAVEAAKPVETVPPAAKSKPTVEEIKSGDNVSV